MRIPAPCEACGFLVTELQFDNGDYKIFEQGEDPPIIVHNHCLVKEDQP